MSRYSGWPLTKRGRATEVALSTIARQWLQTVRAPNVPVAARSLVGARGATALRFVASRLGKHRGASRGAHGPGATCRYVPQVRHAFQIMYEPNAYNNSAKAFLSFFTGHRCAVRAPSGAVNMLAITMRKSAGR